MLDWLFRWYVANYSYAEDLQWGKNLGCDFVKKSCKEWIDDRLKSGQSIRPFCNYLSSSPLADQPKYECNSNRDAVLLCNLGKYSSPIPVQYRVSFIILKLDFLKILFLRTSTRYRVRMSRL